MLLLVFFGRIFHHLWQPHLAVTHPWPTLTTSTWPIRVASCTGVSPRPAFLKRPKRWKGLWMWVFLVKKHIPPGKYACTTYVWNVCLSIFGLTSCSPIVWCQNFQKSQWNNHLKRISFALITTSSWRFKKGHRKPALHLWLWKKNLFLAPAISQLRQSLRNWSLALTNCFALNPHLVAHLLMI